MRKPKTATWPPQGIPAMTRSPNWLASVLGGGLAILYLMCWLPLLPFALWHCWLTELLE